MTKQNLWRYVLASGMPWRQIPRLISHARTGFDALSPEKPTRFDIRIHGRRVSVFLRRGTTDTAVFVEIFRDQIYTLPEGFAPRVILDVGGNIGMASLYFSTRYPDATIHTFEPVPSNLDRLNQHIEANRLENVIVHPYALGKENARISFGATAAGAAGNFVMGRGEDAAVSVTATVRDIREVWEELKLKDVDVAKVDCEGAELDIFRALGDKLKQIDVLVGEMHPVYSDSMEALYLLSRSHHVYFETTFDLPFFPFRASRSPWKRQ